MFLRVSTARMVILSWFNMASSVHNITFFFMPKIVMFLRLCTIIFCMLSWFNKSLCLHHIKWLFQSKYVMFLRAAEATKTYFVMILRGFTTIFFMLSWVPSCHHITFLLDTQIVTILRVVSAINTMFAMFLRVFSFVLSMLSLPNIDCFVHHCFVPFLFGNWRWPSLPMVHEDSQRLPNTCWVSSLPRWVDSIPEQTRDKTCNW